MIEERRAHARVKTRIEARWEGVATSREGTVVDLSADGCFILTADEVQPKELIRLEIPIPHGRRICLWGEVVYQASEIGFALRFTGADEAEKEMIEELVDYARSK